MTRETYIGVLKSVRGQLKLAGDALCLCEFDGETADEAALRERISAGVHRISAGVHKHILMLELGIAASARLAEAGGADNPAT